jgi:hypothetical protein
MSSKRLPEWTYMLFLVLVALAISDCAEAQEAPESGPFEVCMITPTENVDGSPLEAVTVHYSRTSGPPYEHDITVAWDLPGADYCQKIPIFLEPGEWFVVATADDAEGNRSAFSNEVRKVQPDRTPNRPVFLDE